MTAAPSESTSSNGLVTLAALRAGVRSRLGIDPRALAAFRIGLALVLLFDLLVFRIPGLETFYTDGGIFPRSALAEAYPGLARLSLHAQSGSLWVQTLLVGVAVALAACLLVGYRSRLAAAGSGLLLASLHARNPYLANGGDTILVSLLVFGAFLPLDGQWSLRSRPGDRRYGVSRGDGPRILSVATATILLHVAIIYAINAILKFRSEAWMSGVAVRRILHLEDFVFLLGPTLSEYPTALTAINWLWTATLCASVLLVFATGWLRVATVLAFVAAHLGMAATIRLGAFPFVMITALLLYLPPPVWDSIDRLAAGTEVVRRPERVAPRAIEDGTGASVAGPARSPPVRRGSRLAATLLLAYFLLVANWQVGAAGLVDTPSPVDEGELERANWAFFAPNPPDAYSWYVVEAERESGPAIDLVDDTAVDFDRPPNAMARYPSTLWKRYGTKVRGAGDSPLEPVAAYFCERASDDVESVTVHRVDQPVDADGPVGEPISRDRITVSCG
ncbi:HTTM domain-containing protein [Halosolutus halophilus]|uniref:HTTM domain-containing protein n=1 Tax=Halosolutus halophilus TaxID=1552990 RepID=UPI0022350DB1|nr:HTTM domain-containing protein [Halosolutus halophilus]